MNHYLLYYHGGSDNHGCEALVRTTTRLLNPEKNKITLSSFRPEQDYKYGIDRLCDIHKKGELKENAKRDIPWLTHYFYARLHNDFSYIEDYLQCVEVGMKKGDIALSIGGDCYCYGVNRDIEKTNNLFRRYGIKTVLWGCSIEPELLKEPRIAADIAAFELVTARESISYEALKSVNPNTVLVSDSAFSLETSLIQLPGGFESGNLIGLNLSPLAEKSEAIPGMTRKNFTQLIEYCLEDENNKILLIPHVVKQGDDDRTVLQDVYQQYQHTGRIALVEDCSCTELKGYISRCRYFIGARTHATIAAYSTLVPTLVIGYSVKSIGIARDLFGSEEHYVLPVQKMLDENDLVESFKWLENHETEIKNHLAAVLPEYTERVKAGVEALERL